VDIDRRYQYVGLLAVFANVAFPSLYSVFFGLLGCSFRLEYSTEAAAIGVVVHTRVGESEA
jgi:hypothetical protein